jgi:nitrogen regulatory protein PII
MSNEHNTQPAVPHINYTRLITCVLYEGGAEKVLEMLHHKGVNEAFYYGVRGNPIGRASEASGLPEISKTEVLQAVVASDQADYIYNAIYHDFRLDMPGVGTITVNRLTRSSQNVLPEGIAHEEAH